jgi:hypothetical protein
MRNIHCYSVRLQSLTSISDKAFKAKSFDGSEDVIPKSCVFGLDNDVQKSEAYWIASWLLEKKHIQYSRKKEGWFNPKLGVVLPPIVTVIEKHIPTKVEPIMPKVDASLTR